MPVFKVALLEKFTKISGVKKQQVSVNEDHSIKLYALDQLTRLAKKHENTQGKNAINLYNTSRDLIIRTFEHSKEKLKDLYITSKEESKEKRALKDFIIKIISKGTVLKLTRFDFEHQKGTSNIVVVLAACGFKATDIIKLLLTLGYTKRSELIYAIEHKLNISREMKVKLINSIDTPD